MALPVAPVWLFKGRSPILEFRFWFQRAQAHVDVVTLDLDGMASEAGRAAPQAFTGHQIVFPAVPRTYNDVAIHSSLGQVGVFMFAADFRGDERAVILFDNAHRSCQKAVRLDTDMFEILHAGQFDEFHGKPFQSGMFLSLYVLT